MQLLAARRPRSRIPLFSELRIRARMVLAPAELREVRGHRCSIADFCSALVSQVSLLAPTMLL
jgi:hypothetical protein